MERINILFTGGWDSTFRFLQLAQYNNIEIQPIYIADSKRKSMQYELDAMKQIMDEAKRRFPASILDIQKYDKDWILENCKNQEISEAFRDLRKKYKIGGQYEWFALLGNKLNLLMECGVIMQKGENIHKLIETDSEFLLMDNDVVSNRYFVKNNGSKAAMVFGHLIFPIKNYQKNEEKEIATKNNWMDIMELTWFCHTPIDGKPCGLCVPCDDIVDEGMEWRLPEEAVQRHKYRRIYYIRRKLMALEKKIVK